MEKMYHEHTRLRVFALVSWSRYCCCGCWCTTQPLTRTPSFTATHHHISLLTHYTLPALILDTIYIYNTTHFCPVPIITLLICFSHSIQREFSILFIFLAFLWVFYPCLHFLKGQAITTFTHMRPRRDTDLPTLIHSILGAVKLVI